ncbi:MAG: glycosyltransferase [Verrucomicrobiota bacterium]|jgi:glycosyltransferase involved in cell wall biosynthesis|nr:glycosyltransferase [Verrucomicrobiota bacterium]
MKISVITTLYNRPDHFRLFWAALAAQTRRPDELVVADDGSDETVAQTVQAAVAASGIPAVYVRQEKQGFRAAAARNRAVRASTGDYLLFLDCDIALLPDALAAHEAAAASHRLLCGNRALLDEAATRALFESAATPPPGKIEAYWEAGNHAEWQLASRLFDRHARLRKWRVARPHKPKLLGCHFSLFREDVYGVNGFDENFVGWGYEDDDFVRRLYRNGVIPWNLMREARAVHLWHPSLAPGEAERHQPWPNRAYFRRRHVPTYCRNGLQ